MADKMDELIDLDDFENEVDELESKEKSAAAEEKLAVSSPKESKASESKIDYSSGWDSEDELSLAESPKSPHGGGGGKKEVSPKPKVVEKTHEEAVMKSAERLFPKDQTLKAQDAASRLFPGESFDDFDDDLEDDDDKASEPKTGTHKSPKETEKEKEKEKGKDKGKEKTNEKEKEKADTGGGASLYKKYAKSAAEGGRAASVGHEEDEEAEKKAAEKEAAVKASAEKEAVELKRKLKAEKEAAEKEAEEKEADVKAAKEEAEKKAAVKAAKEAAEMVAKEALAANKRGLSLSALQPLLYASVKAEASASLARARSLPKIQREVMSKVVAEIRQEGGAALQAMLSHGEVRETAALLLQRVLRGHIDRVRCHRLLSRAHGMLNGVKKLVLGGFDEPRTNLSHALTGVRARVGGVLEAKELSLSSHFEEMCGSEEVACVEVSREADTWPKGVTFGAVGIILAVEGEHLSRDYEAIRGMIKAAREAQGWQASAVLLVGFTKSPAEHGGLLHDTRKRNSPAAMAAQLDGNYLEVSEASLEKSLASVGKAVKFLCREAEKRALHRGHAGEVMARLIGDTGVGQSELLWGHAMSGVSQKAREAWEEMREEGGSTYETWGEVMSRRTSFVPSKTVRDLIQLAMPKSRKIGGSKKDEEPASWATLESALTSYAGEYKARVGDWVEIQEEHRAYAMVPYGKRQYRLELKEVDSREAWQDPRAQQAHGAGILYLYDPGELADLKDAASEWRTKGGKLTALLAHHHGREEPRVSLPDAASSRPYHGKMQVVRDGASEELSEEISVALIQGDLSSGPQVLSMSSLIIHIMEHPPLVKKEESEVAVFLSQIGYDAKLISQFLESNISLLGGLRRLSSEEIATRCACEAEVATRISLYAQLEATGAMGPALKIEKITKNQLESAREKEESFERERTRLAKEKEKKKEIDEASRVEAGELEKQELLLKQERERYRRLRETWDTEQEKLKYMPSSERVFLSSLEEYALVLPDPQVRYKGLEKNAAKLLMRGIHRSLKTWLHEHRRPKRNRRLILSHLDKVAGDQVPRSWRLWRMLAGREHKEVGTQYGLSLTEEAMNAVEFEMGSTLPASIQGATEAHVELWNEARKLFEASLNDKWAPRGSVMKERFLNRLQETKASTKLVKVLAVWLPDGVSFDWGGLHGGLLQVLNASGVEGVSLNTEAEEEGQGRSDGETSHLVMMKSLVEDVIDIACDAGEYEKDKAAEMLKKKKRRHEARRRLEAAREEGDEAAIEKWEKELAQNSRRYRKTMKEEEVLKEQQQKRRAIMSSRGQLNAGAAAQVRKLPKPVNQFEHEQKKISREGRALIEAVRAGEAFHVELALRHGRWSMEVGDVKALVHAVSNFQHDAGVLEAACSALCILLKRWGQDVTEALHAVKGFRVIMASLATHVSRLSIGRLGLQTILSTVKLGGRGVKDAVADADSKIEVIHSIVEHHRGDRLIYELGEEVKSLIYGHGGERGSDDNLSRYGMALLSAIEARDEAVAWRVMSAGEPVLGDTKALLRALRLWGTSTENVRGFVAIAMKICVELARLAREYGSGVKLIGEEGGVLLLVEVIKGQLNGGNVAVLEAVSDLLSSLLHDRVPSR